MLKNTIGGKVTTKTVEKTLNHFSNPTSYNTMRRGLVVLFNAANEIGWEKKPMKGIRNKREKATINKPIILSTGAAEMIDIESAIKIIRKFHNKIILFHCVSEYPTPIQNANINKINFLKKKFKNCMIGLSDHTTGLSSSYAATAIGVVAIEKHIKLNENSKSEDSKFSLSLSNLKKLKQISKEIFYSLESKNRTQINKTYRRSIYSATNLKKNEIITKKNIKTLRPNIGVSADKFDMIIGMKMKRNLKENQPIFKKFLKKN